MPPIRFLLRGSHAPTPGLHTPRERRLYHQLHAHNANEEMVTYDVPSDSWVQWTRPVRVLHSGALTAVAASGFPNLLDSDGYAPPTCPHASDLTKDPRFSTMELNLRKKFQGRTADYFQVPRSSHTCPFVVVVPSLQPPIILFTQEEINEHCALRDDEEAADLRELYSYDKDFLQPYSDSSNSSPSKASTSSIDEVGDILTPNASSSSPLLSQSSPAGALHSVPVFSLAPSRNHPSSPNFNPRMLPSLSFGTAPRPSPRPLVRSKHLANTRSFFTESVSIARSQSNTSLMTDLFYNDKEGTYQETPSSHPAWRLADPPRVLQPYSEAMYPGCSNRSFQNIDYLMTAMGQAIRELNSSLGIPGLTFNTIVEAAVKCDVCMCMFSPDGYNHHIVNQNCGNSHIALPVTPWEIDVDVIRALRLRTFSEPTTASTAKEFLDTPVGIAYLEFNSKIGVPMDVWAMITTAHVACKTCHLTRTFPGHQAHLSLTGECHDLGEGVASLERGKGKGKAVDLTGNGNGAEPEEEAGA